MTKPINPNISIPEGFASSGQKADFTAEKLQNGFNPIDPDVLSGDNLNKFIDDTYKGLNYSLAGVDDLYKSVLKYDSGETYAQNSLVFSVALNNKVKLYRSVVDNNTGKSLTNTSYWQEIPLSTDTSLLVNKSGDTMTGQLKVKKSGMGYTYVGSDFDFTTAPNANVNGAAFQISDKNENRMARFEYTHRSDGSHALSISDKKNNSENTYAIISIGWDANGNAYSNAPTPAASSNSIGIATTKWVKDFAKTSGANYMSTFSQGNDGYYKYTNGFIIQCGQITNSSGVTPVTFPIAFTTTNYFAYATYYDESSGTTNAYGYPSSRTTTGCSFKLGASSAPVRMWFAFGY